MPAIFTEADREELRRRMFDAGWDLIVEKGVRSLRVEDVASRVGIAKGTFYSFFPSKEEFAYSIVKANRRAVMDLFEELCEQEGGRLGRDAMRTWLRSLWYSDRNIYRYATAEDFAYLSRRWPDEHSFDPEVDRVTMGRIMERLEGVRPDGGLARGGEPPEGHRAHAARPEPHARGGLDAAVDAVIEAICDELFGRKG